MKKSCRIRPPPASGWYQGGCSAELSQKVIWLVINTFFFGYNHIISAQLSDGLSTILHSLWCTPGIIHKNLVCSSLVSIFQRVDQHGHGSHKCELNCHQQFPQQNVGFWRWGFINCASSLSAQSFKLLKQTVARWLIPHLRIMQWCIQRAATNGNVTAWKI